MVATPSTMLPLGTQAPDFALPDAHGKEVTLSQFAGAPATVIIFMCNHCPFVKHLKKDLATFARDSRARHVLVIGINSNDVDSVPDDSPEQMAEDAEAFGYTFPYLVDSTQEVAKAYHAACTPDFYVFNRALQLAYRGQFDDSRPGNNKPITGADIRAALDAILAGRPVSPQQTPSIGCNIKWKPQNAPSYFG